MIRVGATPAAAKVPSLRCLMVPIEDGHLLLPNAVVREVLGYRQVQPLAGAPSWLQGILNWRQQRVPVVSFEALCGRAWRGRGERKRIIICAALHGKADLGFFGIAAANNPKLLKTEEESVRAVADTSARLPVVLQTALAFGEEVMIPDLDRIEALLRDQRRAGVKL